MERLIRFAQTYDLLKKNADEQAETLRQLTGTNAPQYLRALQLAEDEAAVQAELHEVKAVSERGQAQPLDLLEGINLVQTENGILRQQLSTLGKL